MTLSQERGQSRLGFALIECLFLLSLTQNAALANNIDLKHSDQKSEGRKIAEFCQKQLAAAQYIPFYSRPTFEQAIDSLIDSLDSASPERNDEYHFIVTIKGVQGINGRAIQLRNGRYKCDRGNYEEPMRLGHQYTKSEPVYRPIPSQCFRSGLLMPGCGADNQIIGRRVVKRMIKAGLCPAGNGECLYLYQQIDGGAISRTVLSKKRI